MSVEVLIFLALASGFAGFVDAMAGGGGLIQLPALLIGLPNKELPLILGTNKVPSIFGTTAAARNYFKNIKPDKNNELQLKKQEFQKLRNYNKLLLANNSKAIY